MSIFSQISSRLMIIGIISSLFVQNSVQAQAAFSDVRSDNWAAGFIQELAKRGIIRGFQDGSFRPDAPVTRAQFAVMVGKAFDRPTVRPETCFTDVFSTYWAVNDIQAAYREGFLSGYPNSLFRSELPMPRAQVLVALSSGLQFQSDGSYLSVVGALKDYRSIPSYAEDGVAAAAQRRMMVNYPDVDLFDPNRAATRAEVAASIYQGLVAVGKAPVIASPYIVFGTPD